MGPAVTVTRTPARVFSRASSRAMWSSKTSGSGIFPLPTAWQAAVRGDNGKTVLLQGSKIVLGDGVFQHRRVHGRGHQFFAAGRQNHRGEHVIGNAVGQLGDNIGGGRRHQNQVRSGGQGDVGNVILKVPGKGVHHTPVVGQGLKGQGGNKLSGVLGHHHMDLRPRFPQGAGHVGHFIGGNAAGHTQQDALSLQIFHESLAPISPAYRRILLHVPTGGMAQAMSLSRPCFS